MARHRIEAEATPLEMLVMIIIGGELLTGP